MRPILWPACSITIVPARELFRGHARSEPRRASSSVSRPYGAARSYDATTILSVAASCLTITVLLRIELMWPTTIILHITHGLGVSCSGGPHSNCHCSQCSALTHLSRGRICERGVEGVQVITKLMACSNPGVWRLRSGSGYAITKHDPGEDKKILFVDSSRRSPFVTRAVARPRWAPSIPIYETRNGPQP